MHRSSKHSLVTKRRHRLGQLAAAILPTLTLGCVNGANGAATAPTTLPAPYPIGLSDHSLTVAGGARQYRVHVPATLAGAPRAIVLVLHGGGGAGLDVANTGAHPLSVFRTAADRERFVVVYPGGLPATDGNAGWVDCRRDNRSGPMANDEGFLAALIEKVRAEYALPASAVFMAGGSNGAMMTHAFAIARPDLVAGVATSSGSLAADPQPGACSTGPTVSVPIVMVHGTADPQMPYAGGCVADLGALCNRGRVVSAEATRDRWLRANGLIGILPTVQVLDPVPNDGGPANRFDYAGPVPVQWWRLDGAGHTVASRSVLVAPNALSGIQSRDIEFAEVAWAFFAARLR
jgi:polyhydroxybutyrate depolymerase